MDKAGKEKEVKTPPATTQVCLCIYYLLNMLHW